MPILAKETDLFPHDLLDRPETGQVEHRAWWAVYTCSRREKQLMRHLEAHGVSFYGPTVVQRTRSTGGRIRKSYLPLFTNYVFLYGSEDDRHTSLTTNCVSRILPVSDSVRLTNDLRQIHHLIVAGAPLTLEARLEVGTRIRVKSGMFAGREGVVIRRHGKNRLVVAVDFLQQGASVELEDCVIERI